MARMDARGEELMEALVEGAYDAICKEEGDEGMPKAVRVLYTRGLFCKKAVGRGSEKGRATTAADFEELMKPKNEEEWNESRRQDKKYSDQANRRSRSLQSDTCPTTKHGTTCDRIVADELDQDSNTSGKTRKLQHPIDTEFWSLRTKS
jgi:hypothetical protein